MREQLVASLPCSCNEGCRVVVRAPDGKEWVTDMKSSSTAQVRAWVKRVRLRLDDGETDNLTRAKLVLTGALENLLASLAVSERPCTDCGGAGFTMRIYQREPIG